MTFIPASSRKREWCLLAPEQHHQLLLGPDPLGSHPTFAPGTEGFHQYFIWKLVGTAISHKRSSKPHPPSNTPPPPSHHDGHTIPARYTVCSDTLVCTWLYCHSTCLPSPRWSVSFVACCGLVHLFFMTLMVLATTHRTPKRRRQRNGFLCRMMY
jgi:hypothetical protein